MKRSTALCVFAILIIIFSSINACNNDKINQLTSLRSPEHIMQQLTSLGQSGHIKVYSGGVLIYEGDSTGKISKYNSNGYYFEDAKTRKLVRITGDIIIEN